MKFRIVVKAVGNMVFDECTFSTKQEAEDFGKLMMEEYPEIAVAVELIEVPMS